MCAQVLGRYFEALPRWAWACVFIVIELAIGLGGRNSLYTILSNFLALMVSLVVDIPQLSKLFFTDNIARRATGSNS